MSYREKNIITTLLTALLVYGVYFSKTYDLYQNGSFAGAEGATLLGKGILIAIGASIVIGIITSIIFNIVYAIISNTPDPSFVVDERDHQIEARGNQVFFVVFCLGFVASMFALMYAYDPKFVIFLTFSAMYLGSAVGDVTKLVIYRMGL